MIRNKENGEKPHFGPDLGLLAPNSCRQIFFFKNLALSVTRYHGQLSLCTISEKTNDPVLKKLGNGRTDGRTDGWTDGRTDGQTEGGTYRQMDESDFIKRCPTNVERPTRMLLHNSSCVE